MTVELECRTESGKDVNESSFSTSIRYPFKTHPYDISVRLELFM